MTNNPRDLPQQDVILREIHARSMPNQGFITLMEAVLERGKAFRFRAAGFSMAPFIKDGDVLTLSPPGTHKVHIGEILAAKKPIDGHLVVHRVVARRKDGLLLLKADNNPKQDGWVSEEEIIGSVSKVERGEREIRLGLGWEKGLIARLSRSNWLLTSMRIIWKITPPSIRKKLL